MDNRKHPVEFTVTLNNVGTTPVSSAFTVPFAPPNFGWLYRMRVEVASGPATTATIELLETSVSPDYVVSKWPAYTLPFDAADVPVSWGADTASTDLEIQVTTDDAGATTVLNVFMIAGQM